ncbi:MAG: protein translocase subunit SecD, partial [Gemmatimonadales bacterium]
MSTIRGRIIVIAALVLASLWALLPKNVTQRVQDSQTGRMKDTTVRRVPINLGLDLQGGIHLALEVDQSRGPVADCADAIRRAERVVRTRVDEFGTTEPVVQVIGQCRLVVELAGEKDPARAKQIVQKTAFLEFRITDMKNLFRDALPAIDQALRAAGVRGPASGQVSAVSQLFGQDTAKRQDTSAAPDTTPDATAPGALSALLFQGQLPGEYLVPEEQVPHAESLLARPEVRGAMPRGIELRWGTDVESRGARPFRPLYALEDRAIITGEELTKATARRDQMNNHSVVTFDLTRRGSRKFCEETGRHVRDYMAIILDSRVQGQPPIINDQICGAGQIDLQNKPLTEAQDLALVLRAGALPAPLQIVEERTIGPTLGADSIRDGVRASALAVVFVVLVMLVYYRLSGALAVAALLVYVVLALGGLALMGFTLTLPGLAGFALSIGMAVDANVLIFERIREELQNGKTVRLAVDEGFKHAMSAIIDSNVTTVLKAFILYLVGTGPVQGFAVTLIIGISASMITAAFVTR